MRSLPIFLSAVLLLSSNLIAHAQGIEQTKGDYEDKFRQLDEVLPTPNAYRTASGAPGHQYWQQSVDYKIQVSLDEDERRLTASEVITYKNNAPDTLQYLWLQLDQNIFKADSRKEMSDNFGGVGRRGPLTGAPGTDTPAKLSLGELRRQQAFDDHEYGYSITKVAQVDGAAMDYTIVGTLMRIDLKDPLKPGASIAFEVDWSYTIVEEDAVSARAGYEHFPDDEREGGNDIFLIAQWFPRLAVYSDYEGWHNKEFMGRGEFTLEFGNYDLEITVPDDHIVSATGVLQNPDDVVTAAQRKRLDDAKGATDDPVFIVTPDEALKNESSNPSGTRTWRFTAKNVRDFAWASSRKFIWDAMAHKQPGAEHETVMAMSFWPKEGGELWRGAVAQILYSCRGAYAGSVLAFLL